MKPEEKATIPIREQDPLKQGLKPAYARHTLYRGFDSRARSTKTRIETGASSQNAAEPKDSRARSTKTRIETFWIVVDNLGNILFESKIH